MKPNSLVHYALSLLTAAVVLTGAIAHAQVQATTPPQSRPLNVILVLRDQMRHDLPTAAGYNTPALDRLAQQGISFRNNYIASAMCTPSRAALWSGTPPQVNGLFDQAEMGYAVSLRKDRPNMGSMMKKLGYRTAFYGKWEMDLDLLHAKASANTSKALQPMLTRANVAPFDQFSQAEQHLITVQHAFVLPLLDVVEQIRAIVSLERIDLKVNDVLLAQYSPHQVVTQAF